MLFHIHIQSKDDPGVSPMQFFEIAMRQLETLIKLKQQGSLVFSANVAGLKQAIMIVDVPSNEDLEKFMFSLPLFNFVDIQILPLVSTETRLTTLKSLSPK